MRGLGGESARVAQRERDLRIGECAGRQQATHGAQLIGDDGVVNERGRQCHF